MLKTFIDERIARDVGKLSKPDRARIDRIRELFEEKGFSLSELYLKKLSKNIWELRSRSIRLLLGIVGNNAVIVHCFKKTTQKTPIKDLKLAERRYKELL